MHKMKRTTVNGLTTYYPNRLAYPGSMTKTERKTLKRCARMYHAQGKTFLAGLCYAAIGCTYVAPERRG